MSLKLYFSGKIHNQQELCSRLGMQQDDFGSDEIRNLILAAWHRWGHKISEHLLGDFAFVIEDIRSGETFLTRSPLGVKPLYYCILDRKLYHAFSPACLKRMCPVTLSPDQDWMARYMLHLSMDNRKTAYKEMFKVAPSHSLLVDKGAVKEWRHHHWRNDAPLATKRDIRWVEDYRAVLEAAIRCRMDLNAPMGTENSGGIDSATITAYLAHFLGRPGNRLHSFGFALFDQEPSYILETSQAKGIVHNYIISAPPTDEDRDARITQALSVLGYPQEHSNSFGHIPFYRECQLRGIQTLYSGFGGDEVVSNSGRLLKHELLDSGRYANLFDILPGDPLRRGLHLVKAMTLGRKSPAYRPNFLQAWNERWPYQPLRHGVIDRMNLHHAYMETARYDAPYRSINDFIVSHLIDSPYIATRHENCTLLAQSYGVDYRWPLWDVRLVQQYLSTPSIEKVGPSGVGRYLHRRAIDGIVPKRVAWKASKDMGYQKMLSDMSLKNSGLQSAKIATIEMANLHPALTDLIDCDKIKQQIFRAQSSQKQDKEFIFSFARSVSALSWLNRWLSS